VSRPGSPAAVTARRAALPRHEFRVGRKELVVFAGVTVLVWALTFVFGVLVGRELNVGRAGVAGAPVAPAPPAEGDRGSSAASARKGERPGSEEQLTFYKTLTAPTLEVPPPVPPRIDERIVPHDPPAPSPAAAAERPAPPPAAPAPPVEPGARPAPAPRAVAAVRPPPAVSRVEPAAKPAPAPVHAPVPVAKPAAPEPFREAWTVQVSSFRSRALADELRGRLASKGFDAYLVSLTTEDGRVRHRVRVGGFSTRTEAERVAGELRSERDLTPFVTTRAR
jgi:cell division septation protein DedD